MGADMGALFLRSWLAALVFLGAASPSHAANWLEKNFWLSGPRYSGKVPACEDSWALSTIQHRFATWDLAPFTDDATFVVTVLSVPVPPATIAG